MFSMMNVSNHTLLSLINLSSSSLSLSSPPESKLKALSFVYDPGKSRSKAIRAAMLVNTQPFSEYPALTSSACIVSILFGTVPSITSQIGALVALDRAWNASDPGPGFRQQCILFPSLNIGWGGGGYSPHSALQPTAQITSNNIGLRFLTLSKVSYLGSNTGTYLSFPASVYTPSFNYSRLRTEKLTHPLKKVRKYNSASARLISPLATTSTLLSMFSSKSPLFLFKPEPP
jgi:hypothetical protein